MPAAGYAARGRHEATLTRLMHEGLISSQLFELLDEVEASGPEGDDAALVREVRHEADKARRVPAELVEALTLAGSAGQEAWNKARDADDFAAFLPFLERNVELRRDYA